MIHKKRTISMSEYRNKIETVKLLQLITGISILILFFETASLIWDLNTSTLRIVLLLFLSGFSAYKIAGIKSFFSKNDKAAKDFKPSIFIDFNHFEQRANHLISQAKRYSHEFSIVCIGIDGLELFFKDKKTDALKGIEYSLNTVLRESDFLTNSSSGRIYACLPMTTEKWDLTSVAEKIINSLNNYFYISSFRNNVKSNLGISRYPDSALDFASLVIAAEKAMLESKSKGGNTFMIYE